MKVDKNVQDEELTLAVSGRVDTTTAPQLEELMNEAVGDVKSLKFDFEGVDYISSAGLRVLLSAHKKMSTLGGMRVVNVRPEVMEVFEVTGFSDILTIE